LANVDRIFIKFSKISGNFIDFWKFAKISRNSDKIPLKYRRKITKVCKVWQKSRKLTEILENFAKYLQILNVARCEGL